MHIYNPINTYDELFANNTLTLFLGKLHLSTSPSEIIEAVLNTIEACLEPLQICKERNFRKQLTCLCCWLFSQKPSLYTDPSKILHGIRLRQTYILNTCQNLRWSCWENHAVNYFCKKFVLYPWIGSLYFWGVLDP